MYWYHNVDVGLVRVCVASRVLMLSDQEVMKLALFITALIALRPAGE